MRINQIGILALKQVLPDEVFDRLQASCAYNTSKGQGAGVHLDALTAEPLETKFEGKPPGPQVMESLNADRTVLRSVLMSGLEPFVEFGRGFKEYEQTPTGVKVRFTDGKEVEGSLLVGADGTKSGVKKQLLPDHIFVDTEARWFYGKTTLTPEFLEKFDSRAAQSLTRIQDKTNEIPLSLLLEPVRFKDNEFKKDMPADYIYWVLGSRKDTFAMDDAKLLKLTPEEAVLETQKLTTHWHPSIRVLFAMQDVGKTSILRIDSARPELPVWETQPFVTLIGDSVHAMSPTAGVGAVTALRSAALLAQLLGEEGISVTNLRKYEDEMRKYSGSAIERSFWGGKLLFGMKAFAELKPASA